MLMDHCLEARGMVQTLPMEYGCSTVCVINGRWTHEAQTLEPQTLDRLSSALDRDSSSPSPAYGPPHSLLDTHPQLKGTRLVGLASLIGKKEGQVYYRHHTRLLDSLKYLLPSNQ